VYSKSERDEGAGPMRVGKSLPLTHDLYSMLFVSVMHYEYVHEKWCERQDKLGNPRAIEDEPQQPEKTVPEADSEGTKIGLINDDQPSQVETLALAATSKQNIQSPGD